MARKAALTLALSSGERSLRHTIGDSGIGRGAPHDLDLVGLDVALGDRGIEDAVGDGGGVDLAVGDGDGVGVVRAGEDHRLEVAFGLDAGLQETGEREGVARGRGGIDEGEVLALEIVELFDAARFQGDDLAVIVGAAGLGGLGDGEGLDRRHRGGEHVGERPEIGDVEMLGAQRLDDAVVVGGDEALDLHAEVLLQGVEDVLALRQHGARILGGDQADLEDLLGVRRCRRPAASRRLRSPNVRRVILVIVSSL